MIFYFSATGNTLWAARQISQAIGEQLVPITDDEHPVNITLNEGERLGFCFPVHGWRPPLIVRRFISRLVVENLSLHYVFALCTAGDTVGEAIDIFRNDLSQRSIPLHAVGSLLMPESYVGMPFMDVDTPQREKEKIEASAQRLQGIIADIMQRRPIASPLDIGRWPRINSRLIGSVFVKWLITDNPFRVDPDRCLRCGRCATLCPVHDIEAQPGHLPQWQHNGRCLTCFSCYHHCPVHAISFGWRTKGKGQYFLKVDE